MEQTSGHTGAVQRAAGRELARRLGQSLQGWPSFVRWEGVAGGGRLGAGWDEDVKSLASNTISRSNWICADVNVPFIQK
jgi:hypothetical protein